MKQSSHTPGQVTLLWDGVCGFCKYWITHWRTLTGDAVAYRPYQKAMEEFPQISEQAFKKAVHLVDDTGRIFAGAHAAYKTLALAGRWTFLLRWYEAEGMFHTLSDAAYRWIAEHRSFMMKFTRFAFGKDPVHLRPLWVYYLMIVFAVVILLIGI